MYKRFIVFNWPDFDPPSPFDCVMDSFDDEIEALEFMRKQIEEDESEGPPYLNYCVFDCDLREIIDDHSGDKTSKIIFDQCNKVN